LDSDNIRIQDTWTALQEYESDFISDGCSLDTWSDDEEGFIPSQRQSPLPHLSPSTTTSTSSINFPGVPNIDEMKEYELTL